MKQPKPEILSTLGFDLSDADMARRRIICASVQLAYTNHIEGDFAEFGISYGWSFGLIAATMKICEAAYPEFATSAPRDLHGFDSFQGFPVATKPEDIDAPAVQLGIWGEGKCGSHGVTTILQKAAAHIAAERVILYPGWFSETLSGIPEGTKFALTHLDCDLYESTAEVLTELFANNRLSDGAILLFDDFLCNRGSKKFGQRKAWAECVKRFAPDFTDLGFYGRDGWRCLIHR